MLSIDRMILRLSGSRAGRAEAIARLAARELAAMPLTGSRSLSRLTVPRLEIESGASDEHLAHLIAQAVHAQLSAQGPTATEG